jgi:adenine-specific DNA-methyltransferase
LRAEKDNAGQMIAKAKQLHGKINKSITPDCIKESIKLGANIKAKDYSRVYSLNDANDDFWKWLKSQPFLEGEKAYRYIDENGDVFRPVSLAAPKNSRNRYSVIHPLTKKPCACPATGWRNKEETMNELIAQGNIIFGKDEKTIPNRKYKLKDFLTQTLSDLISYAGNGIDDLRSVSKNDLFDNPKPLFLMRKLLGAISNSDAIVLDFFAGSGTTGQAVLELNKEDGGHRQFILCTNNGDKGPDSVKIAEDITYPRIKTVITGERQDGSKYSDGIPANLRYYKIDHIEKKQSIDANRLEIVRYLEDIIQVKENSYEQCEVDEDFALYKNSERFVGMVFDPFALEEAIGKIKEKNTENLPVKLYVFSYSRDAFEDNYETDFEIEFVAMPEGLLKTYANIVTETKKEDA